MKAEIGGNGEVAFVAVSTGPTFVELSFPWLDAVGADTGTLLTVEEAEELAAHLLAAAAELRA